MTLLHQVLTEYDIFAVDDAAEAVPAEAAYPKAAPAENTPVKATPAKVVVDDKPKKKRWNVLINGKTKRWHTMERWVPIWPNSRKRNPPQRKELSGRSIILF